MSGTYQPLATYTILTADGGIDGTFGGATSLFAFLIPKLSHGANSVTLELARNDVGFADVAMTPNQSATALAAEQLGSGNSIYGAILGLTDDQARAAFDALSGEGHATFSSLLAENAGLVPEAMQRGRPRWQGRSRGRFRTAVDENPAGEPLRFRTCVPIGCLVPLAFDAEAIDELRSGMALKVKTSAAEGGQEALFSISLQGFAAALERAAELSR